MQGTRAPPPVASVVLRRVGQESYAHTWPQAHYAISGSDSYRILQRKPLPRNASRRLHYIDQTDGRGTALTLPHNETPSIDLL